MKIQSVSLLSAFLLSALSTQASITDVTYADDGDGAIVCPIYTWQGTENVGVYGDQFWGPGHINFDVTTDTEADPTLVLFNAIDNDTGYSWNGYEVDIMMNKTFTISSASVVLPAGWSSATIQPGAPVAGTYTGSMIFTGGPAVADGGSLDFSFALSWLGAASFCEQLVPVPEPSILALLAGGILLVAGKMGARRQ